MKSKPSKYRWTLRTLFLVTTIVCVLGTLWYLAARMRESARSDLCGIYLKSLVLSLNNYHDRYEQLPTDHDRANPAGRDHSWRVGMTPFLVTNPVPDVYDWSQPWDSGMNRKLAYGQPVTWVDKDGVTRTYQLDLYYCFNCPHYETHCNADYVAVSGPGTAFPDVGTVSFNDFIDGRSETIVLVEIRDSDINWLEPRDLRIDEMSFRTNDPTKPSIGSYHHGGPHVAFADGEVFQVNPRIPPETLRALLTIDGGEDVSRQQLIDEGLLW